MKNKKPEVTDFNTLVKWDRYQIQAIRSCISQINQYAILKNFQPVPNLCKLITKGKKQVLCITYKRCEELDEYFGEEGLQHFCSTYYLELTWKDCCDIMKANV